MDLLSRRVCSTTADTIQQLHKTLRDKFRVPGQLSAPANKWLPRQVVLAGQVQSINSYPFLQLSHWRLRCG
jgi:hypothetical protein